MTPHVPCRLEIERLRKTYAGGIVAVDDVDVTLEGGDVLALLGPSGCGKTTLLQSIAGFVAPDAGDIRLDGASILTAPPEKRRTAMMFQHYALFPHMSVRDNVGFGLKMRRVPRVEAEARIAEALRLVRIEPLADRRPGQLSGGQKQRVALARAIVTEPRMLLLDEPLGALDQNLREEMQVEIRKLQRRLGLTTVMVTHDQREAIVLADRIAVMHAGRIEQIGVARDIYDHPATSWVARFTGVENFLSARRLSPGVAAIGDVALAGVHDRGATTDDLVLAVRSEALTLAAGPRDGALSGTISFVQMLGPSMRYEVELVGGGTVTVTESRRDATSHDVGAAVSVRATIDLCSLLARDVG